jgi:hypothetical protein
VGKPLKELVATKKPNFDTSGTAAGVGALNGVPAFARQTVDWSKVKEVMAGRLPGKLKWVAGEVDGDDPTTIKVRNRKGFTPPIRGHESTHVSQFARTDGVEPGQDLPEPHDPNATAMYDYGGVPGLLKARAEGKTMANFNVEQQAQMVKDYIQASRQIEQYAKEGKVNKYDLADYADLQNAYHPFIKQLAPQPEGDEINTHPEAPGLPPADTPGLGMLKPDPLLGGDPVPLNPNKSKTKPNAMQGAQDPFMAAANPKGLVEKGNLPIWHRPIVHNADGTISSEYSTSFGDDDGHEVLVPTVVGGKFLTPNGKKPPEGSPAEKAMFQAAWQHYLKTGEHLGKFDNPDNADAYSQVLHNRKVDQSGTPAGPSGQSAPKGKQTVTPESDWDENDYKAHGMTPPKGKKVADTKAPTDGSSAHDRLQEVTARAVTAMPPQLQRHLSSDKVQFGHGALEDSFITGRPDYAGVVKGEPHTILFDHNTPLDDYTVQQLVAHEGMHIIQHNLPPEIAAKIPADDEKDPYNYGGAQGLIDLRKKGGTILSLPWEKQAAAIQYYVSQRPHVTGQAASDMDAAYKPYLEDLDKLPQSTVQPTAPSDTSAGIVTTPRAPTPPPEAYQQTGS